MCGCAGRVAPIAHLLSSSPAVHRVHTVYWARVQVVTTTKQTQGGAYLEIAARIIAEDGLWGLLGPFSGPRPSANPNRTTHEVLAAPVCCVLLGLVGTSVAAPRQLRRVHFA